MKKFLYLLPALVLLGLATINQTVGQSPDTVTLSGISPEVTAKAGITLHAPTKHAGVSAESVAKDALARFGPNKKVKEVVLADVEVSGMQPPLQGTMLVVSFDTTGQRLQTSGEPGEPQQFVTVTSDPVFFDAQTGVFIAANQTGVPEE